MTAPSTITASNSPDKAWALAANGSSKAPGTHATVTSPAPTPAAARPRRAPSSKRKVTRSLNRLHTTATRRPAPSNTGSTRSAALASEDIVETVEDVAHAFPLGAEVVDVLR